MTKAAPLLLFAALGLLGGFAPGMESTCRAQDPTAEIPRPAPPPRDDLENDDNNDGVPDGWYNARDASIQPSGGASGPRFIRFECPRRGRPARISRAFGVDGRRFEAIVLGLWIRVKDIEHGERSGEEPGLLIDFLGDELRQLSRGTMGPWRRSVGDQWTYVSKRIPVPPGTRDAIMSVGLLGASGRLDVDGFTFELVPRDVAETTNLVVNGGFELGDPDPAYWMVNNGARRVFPGRDSTAAVELSKAGARVLTGIAPPVEGLGSLEIAVSARGRGLRGSGGAAAAVYFLNEVGEAPPGQRNGVQAFRWGGSFDWRPQRTVIPIPRGAVRAVVQFEKIDGVGSIQIDDVEIASSPAPELASWSPFHVRTDVDGWSPVGPSPVIAPGTALDFAFLNPEPAGAKGFVKVRNGRLSFDDGTRARFFGVSLIAPTAFLEPERADELADRLARSGVNLVRLGDLDTALGPDRSLFDDARDDTAAFDANALKRLDHLIAALKARGIYVALELQSARIFRDEDPVKAPGLLPPGGGPAAVFDPSLGKLSLDASQALLGRVNPETKLSLRDDPALAWVTLAGEVSLFDQIDRPDALPDAYAADLRARSEKSSGGSGRRFWRNLESEHYADWAAKLREGGLKAPVAGVSHWRREPEFVASLAAPGLDLVDDRLYWAPPLWADPELRSLLWSLDGGLTAGASLKRAAGRPYVVGQWCARTLGAWALPHEAADQLLASATALWEDWDALVRRGIFVYPKTWGEGPVGTTGGEDIFQVAEVANAIPQVHALWPHAASILLRGESAADPGAAKAKARPAPGWEPGLGRLTIDTPFTQGIAGWNAGREVSFPTLKVSSESNFSVVVASSAGSEPIADAKRLLVTAIGRVEPTGHLWVDPWRRDVADPGRPPLLQEPVEARVAWSRSGTIEAFVLDNTGARVGRAKTEPHPDGDGVVLVIDGRTPAMHWELIAP